MAVANITAARFQQHGIYLVAHAYQGLGVAEGLIEIRLGNENAAGFEGWLTPVNAENQGFVVCHELYTEGHDVFPELPLRLRDQVDYETGPGWLQVNAIIRGNNGAPPPGPVTVPAPAPPQPDGDADHNPDLPAYLAANQERIRELGPQMLPEWSEDYNGWNEQPLRRLYHRFPDQTLSRNEVTTLFQEWEDPALALAAMAIWGWIKLVDLRRMLALDEDELVAKMNAIRDLVTNGDLENAFITCSAGGANKIAGIGTSYFTKIFFFLGQTNPDIALKPLVLDKWTKNAYFFLLQQQDGRDAAAQQFRVPSLDDFIAGNQQMQLCGGVPRQTEAYVAFVERMNEWAEHIGVAPDMLEQFVFGIDRRVDATAANPRVEILALIRAALAHA
jgi:hypothetical protein